MPPPVTVTPAELASPVADMPPENVEVPVPKTVSVPVAVILATEVRFPEIKALPCTPKLCDGVVLPIPKPPPKAILTEL